MILSWCCRSWRVFWISVSSFVWCFSSGLGTGWLTSREEADMVGQCLFDIFWALLWRFMSWLSRSLKPSAWLRVSILSIFWDWVISGSASLRVVRYLWVNPPCCKKAVACSGRVSHSPLCVTIYFCTHLIWLPIVYNDHRDIFFGLHKIFFNNPQEG